MEETKILFSIIMLLSSLTFFTFIAPPQFQVISPLNIGVLGANFIGVAGTCAIATGIPCGIMVAVFGVIDIFSVYFASVSNDWIQLLVFVPVAFITLYISLRLARGGG